MRPMGVLENFTCVCDEQLQIQAREGEKERMKLALAVVVSFLRLFSAILLIREFTSRNIQRNMSVGEYPQKVTSAPSAHPSGGMMFIQLGIKTHILNRILYQLPTFDCDVPTTKN